MLTLTSGIGAALAAPGDTSNASGQFLSGSLFSLPLSSVIDLSAATASNDGTQPLVVNRENIDLTALGAINVQIPGGIQLPLDIANAGVLTQYAGAGPDGESLGASGAVGDEGAIGVGNVPPGEAPGDLSLSLSGVVGGLGLNPALLSELANLNLTVGAVSAQASQAAPAAAAGDYEIADLDLGFQSPTLASLTGIINTTVATLQTQLGGVEAGLETVIGGLAGVGALATVNATVTVPPLTNSITTLLTTPLSSGGVTIDLATGTVNVDLAVLNDLNNLPPNTNVLSAAQITAITTNITSLVAGLVTSVGNALQATINGTAVTATATALAAVPLLNINTTLGNLLSGNVSGITLLGGLTVPGGLAGLVALLVAPITSTTNLGNVIGLLSPLVINPVANLVIPAIAPVLNAALSLTANVQSTAGGVFTETALRVAVLPLTATPLIANLATATVGPNAVIPDAVITAIDPAQGPESGGTEVTLTGMDFGGTTTITVDGEPVTPTAVTPTTITFITPAHPAGVVPIVVNAPQGDSAPVNFEYLAVPSATTSIDPTEGSEAGGTPVTITGSGFVGATDVTFDGISGVDVEVVNDSTITATTPAHAAGAVNVEVVDPAGNSGALVYTYLALPSVATSLDPTSGPVVGGNTVTITGSGFTGASDVLFDSTLGTAFTVVNDTTITVVAPAGDPGPVAVVVVDPAGNSTPALTYTYVAQAAAATSIDPIEGTELGGTPVTITGSGFLGATAVEFDGVEADAFTVVNDTTITATTPVHAPGLAQVVVLDPAGDSAPIGYTFLASASAVTGIDPDEGPETGGTPVTLTGTGFTGATAVEFDGVAGTAFAVVDDTTITVTTPVHAPGLAQVVVVDAAGGNSAPVGFTFVAEASDAVSLDPVEGTELGGTAVTVTGTGFLGATAVEFDGIAGTAFTVVNDTTITVTSPVHAPGLSEVVVVDAAGNSAALDYTFVADAAVVTDLDPTEGPEIGGTPVTLTGTGFTGATAVEFDGAAGTDFVVVDDTTITVTSPAHDPGTVDVVVIDEAGGDSDPVDFTYLAQAAVATSINPIEGTELGGTPVTLTGSGFTGATAVEFDGAAGTAFTVVDDATITVTTPVHAPGAVEVIVVDAAGNSAPLEFTFVAVASVVTTIAPDDGPESGGTPVTLTGTGFTGATGATFDGAAGTAFTVVNDTTITVTTPAHVPGLVDVVVVDDAGASTPVGFEYLAVAADAATIAPDSGSEAGGTAVTITGTGFLGATGVEFDGVAGTGFTVVNDTTITVTSPVHAPGLVGVVVLDPAGNGDPLDFEFVADTATAISIDPTFGPSAGGTPVTITGTGFIGATGVEFDGVAGTGFTVVNDTTITVTTPPNDAGLVDVVVLDPAGDSDPLVFEYDAEASVATALNPAEGSELGRTPVTITGNGFIGATGVEFDGTAGTDFVVVNDTTITVTSPAHAPGIFGVVVIDPTGNSAALEFTFTSDAAVLATIDPAEGTEAGGTPVTLTGSGFTGATGVEFNGIPGTAFVVVDDTTITVVTPAGEPGTADVVVIDELGGNSAAIDFEFVAVAADVTEIDPAAGPVVGGTPVTLTGTGFLGATGVEFDGVAGTDFVVVNDTTITVTSPANDPGVVDVVVLDPTGDSDPIDFEYLAEAAVATSLTPIEGTELGGTPVTVTGTGFLGSTAVEFDGLPGSAFTVVDDATITVTSPAHAPGLVDVVVVDAAGDSAPLDYTYLAVESAVTTIDPAEGPETGGTPVTLTGSGFTGSTGVTFDGVAGTAFVVVDDTSITVTTPAHLPGVVDVVVVDEAGGDSAAVDFTYLAEVAEATSIDPDDGTELGGTPVTITGTGFLGATGVTFDDVAGTAFTVVDDTTITVTTPAHTPGVIDVVVVDAAGGNSAPIDFEFLAVGSDATTIDPTSGPVVGGTPVTIRGTGFTGATAVGFDGIAGTDFVVVNDTTITVTTPAHDPGTVEVVVIDEAGGDSDPVDFTYVAQAAAATSIDPIAGTELGGTPVTITGSGFLGATAVEFDGGAGTAFTVVDDTTITVTTPAHAVGPVEVVVIDAAGNSAALEYTYLAVASVVAAIDPANGPETGGTPVTLTGSGFTGSTGVTFDGVAGTAFVVVDDTSITVTTPAHLPGVVDVVVVDAAGGDSLAVEFTYLAVAADATSIVPNSGSEAGGTPVTITGTGFLGATGVEFDGVAGTAFTVVNDTTITVATPAHAPGLIGAVVLDPAGNSDPISFEFAADAATAISIDPASGPSSGGTPVTITGTGFLGATGVEFNGTPGTAFVVVNDTTITVTTPANDAGLAEVIVLDPTGDSDPLVFEYDPEASVATAVDPAEGSELGGTPVTITGSGFLGATGVEFDGGAGTGFTVVNDTTITAISPAHAPAVVGIVVIDPTGNSGPLEFTYLSDAAVLDTIAPAEGPETGGTPVTLTGSGFTGATGVTFGDVPGTEFTVVNDTTITVTSPAGAPGVVDVVVVDELGGDSAAIDFEFLAVGSAVDTIAPAEGPESGGTPVTLSGTGFAGATGVTFGGTPGTDFVVVDDSTITVTSPAGAPGIADVVVVDELGGDSAAIDFEYLAVGSVVDTIAPAQGPESGGTPVTLSGTGFTGATGVTFGGTPGTDFVVVDDTTITVTSPAGAPGIADVVVVDSVGGDSAPIDFEYLAVAADATSIDPIEGPELGGAEVTITGTGFLGATGVAFDGLAGTDFVVVDDTTITVTSPAHAPEIVGVVVLDPEGDSEPLEFEYFADESAVDAIDPAEGSEAGGTAVTLTGFGFTGATGVEFDGVLGTDFVVVDDETITVSSPPHAPGIVDVIVVDEVGGDSDAIDFEYLAVAADATSITPIEGSEIGGTAVTITGTGFLGATGVEFDGLTGTTFAVVDDTTITVTTPAHAPGLVDVVVLDPSGDSEALAFEFLAGTPVVDTVDPTEGTESGGTTVTLTGSGFTGATSVEFDGVAGTGFTVVDDTTITVVTPPHVPATVDAIVIDEPGGNSDAFDFTFVPAPSDILEITPDAGPEQGGTMVTLMGVGFTGATGVEFNSRLASNFIVWSDTMISVMAPPNPPAEDEDVVVLDDAGGDIALFDYFVVAADPEIITPSSGSELGGTQVTITGSGFVGATAVEFDDIPGTAFTVVDDNTITVTTPPHAAGTINVRVIDQTGVEEPLAFEFVAGVPAPDSIDPTFGPETGGTVVTIGGAGFVGSTGVTFDGIPGTDFEVLSDTAVTVTTPQHVPGIAVVVVEDPAGNSDEIGFLFVAEPAAATSIDPTEGTEAGGTPVTITGSGFLGATAVQFDGTPGTAFTVVDDETITVTTPAHAAGLVTAIVVDAAGNSAPLEFEFVAVESAVDTIVPDEGPESGGTAVTLTGSGFVGATAVEFDGTPGTAFTVVNDTTITVTSPVHLPGVIDVVVIDDAGGDSDPVDFEYLAVAADATALAPNSGSEAGGTVVTITGTGFLGATGVEFDGIAGTEFTVVDDTTITVTSPAHDPGLIGVVVLDPAGDSEPVAFEFVAVASAATALEPPFGPAEGGTVVTVTGSGFLGATGVTFDGIAATAFEVLDDTTITVTSPAHAPGLVDVVVVDPAGNSVALVFEYDPEPSDATSINPVTGSEAGGTAVTITGSGFTGSTGVTFDGIAGTAFTVVDDATITVTSPAHAPGPVDVVVEDPAGSSEPLDFAFFALTGIEAIAPSTGPEAGGTTVTLTGTCFTGATAVLFGDVEVTDFTVSPDGTTITVVSPAGVGLVDVAVVGSAECGTATVEDGFSYVAAASVVTTLDPARGPRTGGTVVTLTGSGFTGATGVTFGGVSARSFRVLNDTTISVESPASAVGTVEVIVLDPSGNSAPAAYEFYSVAVIAGVSPDSGPTTGNTTVRITGECFTGTTAVRFGSTLAKSFTVNAAGTVITAVSPAGTGGSVDITVLGGGECGSVSLANAFDYVTPVAPGLPASGVSIKAGLWAALLLLIGGAAVLFIRHRSKSNNVSSK